MNRRHIIMGACLALLLAAPGFAETLTFEGDRLTVRNVIGQVRVEGARGSAFEVEAELRYRLGASHLKLARLSPSLGGRLAHLTRALFTSPKRFREALGRRVGGRVEAGERG